MIIHDIFNLPNHSKHAHISSHSISLSLVLDQRCKLDVEVSGEPVLGLKGLQDLLRWPGAEAVVVNVFPVTNMKEDDEVPKMVYNY